MDMVEREHLPSFPDRGQASKWKGLRVHGLVKNTRTLSAEDMVRLPQDEMVEDFKCEEGWVVRSQIWEGVPVREILHTSSPLPEARYVSFSAADFQMGLPLEEAKSPGALLASRLNGRPLAPEHGGPCRLVIVGKECFYSIKWVDNIEVTATRPVDTAKEIALKRIG